MHNSIIAILGSEGFIGSHVVQFCRVSGVPVIELPRWNGNQEHFEKQIQKLKLENSEKQIYLLQTAWYSTSNTDYRFSPQNYEWVKNTKAILEICKRYGIIFAGLGTCLEKQSIDQDLYTSCKSEIRSYLHSQSSNIEWIWFQLHYVYSVKEQKPAVLRKAKEASDSEVSISLATPNDKHDFIEVRDVADALVHSLSNGLRGIIEIGTGKTVGVSYLLESLFPRLEIAEGIPSEKRISYQGAADTYQLVNTGWEPKFSVY
jgi:nucleoside-diphosphate-sugar epimerase